MNCPNCGKEVEASSPERLVCLSCGNAALDVGKTPGTYAGFVSRFWAIFIDGLILFPLTQLFNWLDHQSKAGAIAAHVGQSLAQLAYVIVLHALLGQTLGKKYMNIEVRTLDGKRISWRHAILRSSVELASTILYLPVIVFAIVKIPDADFSKLEWGDLNRLLMKTEAFPMWLIYFSSAWALGELIFLLTNKKRRALHDFIAGTVVVYK